MPRPGCRTKARENRRWYAPKMTPAVRTELRALWRLALPLALAQTGQAMMGMVDTAVVGRLSVTAQGGAGLGNSLTFTVIFLGMGVMMGLDPLIAQAFGSGDKTRARSLYWTGVWLAGLTSVVLMVLTACLPLILEPFGVDAEVAKGANAFIWFRLPGVPAALLFIGARAYLQAAGRAHVMLLAMLAANLANFGLDLALVFGVGPIPAMGVAGAALSTSLCSYLQFGLLAWALGPPLPGVVRRFDLAPLVQAAKLGLPIGLTLIAESGIFTLVGLFAARLGDAPIAAHQIALAWASVSFCVAVGIGSAGSVRVGWGVGRRDTPAARRSGFVAFGSGIAFMACASLMFVLFPGPLARVMSTQPEVIAVASSLFWVTAVFQISDGVQAIGAGVLRGAGDTRFVFWANILGHWLLGLPIAYWLGVRGSGGVVGLWWGLSAGLTAVGAALLIRFALLSRAEIVPLAQVDGGASKLE